MRSDMLKEEPTKFADLSVRGMLGSLLWLFFYYFYVKIQIKQFSLLLNVLYSFISNY